MKKEIITIAGDLGSGKSTTANIVGEILGFERFSSGSLMRDMAEKRGISIGEMNRLAEKDLAIDYEIDSTIQRIGKKSDKLVIDSRTAWHWIPESFKVYLKLNPTVAAERIFKSLQTSGRTKTETASSVKEAREKTSERLISEQKRFIERYGIDPRDTSQYDLIVETDVDSPDQVSKKVIAEYKRWRQE
ncbi:MAG: cytidylate kinase family protein [Candidatus Paceibacterota bacterium]